ncbi:hypothetical protein IAU60_000716 [Kwoniella sp. DSM 27419]
MYPDTASLRAHLLASLSALANPFDLGLTVLTSEPKRTSSVFPHTPSPPRCLQQEFLMVLSSDLPSVVAREVKPDDGADSSDGATTDNVKARRNVLVSAISAYLYIFPSTSSSSSSGTSAILYISKLDSSGYSPAPLPLTRNLIESFIGYFIQWRPFDEVRVQLFARAQRQYLFPNSADGAGKKVLSGAGLCKWWKGVYEGVVAHHAREEEGKSTRAGGSLTSEAEDIHLAYLLPGYEEVEARNLLGAGKPLPAGLTWAYGPPFKTAIGVAGGSTSFEQGRNDSSPLPGTPSGPGSLATLIPSLPDDPKTRFLEELVTDAIAGTNPQMKRIAEQVSASASGAPEPSPAAEVRKSKKERERLEEEKLRKEAHLALSKVSADEFWERIGFRQECASGDVTGFFTLEVRRRAAAAARASESGHSFLNKGHREAGAGIPATSESTVPTTLTVLDPEVTSSSAVIPPVENATDATMAQDSHRTHPTGTLPPAAPANLALRQEILDRLLTALTNVDFANLALAEEGTSIWLSQAESIVRGEIGTGGWASCHGVVVKKDGAEVSQASIEKRERKEEVVTMLQPRKKKKKV